MFFSDSKIPIVRIRKPATNLQIISIIRITPFPDTHVLNRRRRYDYSAHAAEWNFVDKFHKDCYNVKKHKMNGFRLFIK